MFFYWKKNNVCYVYLWSYCSSLYTKQISWLEWLNWWVIKVWINTIHALSFCQFDMFCTELSLCPNKYGFYFHFWGMPVSMFINKSPLYLVLRIALQSLCTNKLMWLITFVARVFLFIKYKLALFVARISLESVRPKLGIKINAQMKKRSSYKRWENSKHVMCSLWFNIFVLMYFVVFHTITSCNSPAPYFPAYT